MSEDLTVIFLFCVQRRLFQMNIRDRALGLTTLPKLWAKFINVAHDLPPLFVLLNMGFIFSEAKIYFVILEMNFKQGEMRLQFIPPEKI